MRKTRVEHITTNGIETKYCGRCGTYVDISFFGKSSFTWDRLSSQCLPCRRQYGRSRKEEIAKYIGKNKQKIADYQKQYYLRNKERLKNQVKTYREQHPLVSRKYYTKRRKDPTIRLHDNFTEAVRRSIRTGRVGAKWEGMVNYTVVQLKSWLESQWKPEMTWENYGFGLGKWNIDHIKPVVMFSFTSYNDPEFAECWSLRNLQPLFWEDNRKKNSFYGDNKQKRTRKQEKEKESNDDKI